MNLSATVKATDTAGARGSEPRILLEIAAADGCLRCANGAGCARLADWAGKHRHDVSFTLAELRTAGWRGAAPAPGQVLHLQLARARAAGLPIGAWAYAVPLTGLLIGAILGSVAAGAVSGEPGATDTAALRDLLTAIGMATGLAAGVLAWKSLARLFATGPALGRLRITQALATAGAGQTSPPVTGDRPCASQSTLSP